MLAKGEGELELRRCRSRRDRLRRRLVDRRILDPVDRQYLGPREPAVLLGVAAGALSTIAIGRDSDRVRGLEQVPFPPPTHPGAADASASLILTGALASPSRRDEREGVPDAP